MKGAQVTDLKHWSHNYHKRGRFFVACQDWNFCWIPEELQTFLRLWKEGKPIWEIAEQIGRPIKELAILIIDLAEREEIRPRPGGVFGGWKANG